MKKELSTPAIIGIVAIALVVVGGIYFLGFSGPPPIPAGQKLPGYKEGIPDYVKKAQNGERPAGPPAGMGDTSHLTPEQRAAIEGSMKGGGR